MGEASQITIPKITKPEKVANSSGVCRSFLQAIPPKTSDHKLILKLCSLTQQASKSPTFKFLERLKVFYLFQHPAQELHLSTSELNPKTLVPVEKSAMKSIRDDIKLSNSGKNAMFLLDFYSSNTTKNFKSSANSEGLPSCPTTFKITNLQILQISTGFLPI